MLHAVRFPDGIAPARPIHTKPVVTINTGLGFKLKSSQGSAAVRLSGAFDFPENVQFRQDIRS